MNAEELEAMNQKNTWYCEHCKKTYRDPDNVVRYFHTCHQRRAYWNELDGEQG